MLSLVFFRVGGTTSEVYWGIGIGWNFPHSLKNSPITLNQKGKSDLYGECCHMQGCGVLYMAHIGLLVLVL